MATECKMEQEHKTATAAMTEEEAYADLERLVRMYADCTRKMELATQPPYPQEQVDAAKRRMVDEQVASDMTGAPYNNVNRPYDVSSHMITAYLASLQKIEAAAVAKVAAEEAEVRYGWFCDTRVGAETRDFDKVLAEHRAQEPLHYPSGTLEAQIAVAQKEYDTATLVEQRLSAVQKLVMLKARAVY